MPDGGQAVAHGSAQMTRVAEGPHRQAPQVHRLEQVGQQRPLQADHAPPVTPAAVGEEIKMFCVKITTNSELKFLFCPFTVCFCFSLFSGELETSQ